MGETRDTNSGDLAGELTALGVEVARIALLPDDLDAITDALMAARDRADLVVTSGGLGPTPDDLTREAIAGVLGATAVWMPTWSLAARPLGCAATCPSRSSNVKQAWLIPGAERPAEPQRHGARLVGRYK